MDYAKGLPEDLKLVPILGNISGGCVDKEDNLYCGLRGGSFMSPYPATCLIKLDPEGNYLGKFGKGKLGHLHFFEVTDHGTIVILQTNNDYAIEMDLKTEEVVRTFGEKDHPRENGRDVDGAFNLTRIHNGVFATEPFAGYSGGTYAQYLVHQTAKLAKPFNKPTDVDFDSRGNYYFSDGYGNVAVHVFDTEGNVMAYCSHNMSQPSGVDTDGKYVYVAGRGGYLTIFDLECNIVGRLGFFNGNLRAHHIAADSRGNRYLFPTHANFEHQIIALKRVR